MEAKFKIELIDLAINSVIENLKNGIEIKEYQIDNVKIVKRSPFELIEELRKIKAILKKESQKNRAKFVQYILEDGTKNDI